MKPLHSLARLVLLITLTTSISHAGGPLVVGNAPLGTDGEPIVWDQRYMPIMYVTDGGALGALTNTQANDRVQQAFDAWHNVSTASISFMNIGGISGIPAGDVTTVSDLNQVVSDCQDSFETAIVYDADGSLFLDLFSDPNVVGFSSVCVVSSQGFILSALAALNGAYANQGDLLTAAMIHEFGHVIGLDHSQIECLDTCTSDDRSATPTMYPVLLAPEQAVLAPDDIVWASTLYPGPTFATAYGHVSGSVRFSDGITPVQDVNVVFRQADNPSTQVNESRAFVYSAPATGLPETPASPTPRVICPAPQNQPARAVIWTTTAAEISSAPTIRH
jgi:hypothetical protein